MRRLDFEEIHARVGGPADLIAPLRAAFAHPPVSPPREHHSVGCGDAPGTLLIMPAWRPGELMGVKLVSVFPANPQRGLPSVTGCYVLMSAATGEVLAVLDGRALTLLRTAAVSALAADLLAPADARTLLMVGAGALAPYLVEAHLKVRAYERVLVWARDVAKAKALAARLAAGGIEASPAPDLGAAAGAADVVSCATLAKAPVIQGRWLKPGAHLDLVGGFRPDMREADDDAVRRGFLVADTAAALKECGDLAAPVAAGVIGGDAVGLLTDLVAGRLKRPADPGLTLFKSVGSALSDLAAAEWILQAAPSPPGRGSS